MERGDVLKRNQNVAVELYVSDLLYVAVSRQDARLIIAAEERVSTCSLLCLFVLSSTATSV